MIIANLAIRSAINELELIVGYIIKLTLICFPFLSSSSFAIRRKKKLPPKYAKNNTSTRSRLIPRHELANQSINLIRRHQTTEKKKERNNNIRASITTPTRPQSRPPADPATTAQGRREDATRHERERKAEEIEEKLHFPPPPSPSPISLAWNPLGLLPLPPPREPGTASGAALPPPICSAFSSGSPSCWIRLFLRSFRAPSDPRAVFGERELTEWHGQISWGGSEAVGGC